LPDDIKIIKYHQLVAHSEEEFVVVQLKKIPNHLKDFHKIKNTSKRRQLLAKAKETSTQPRQKILQYIY
jgi:hypothetical protein